MLPKRKRLNRAEFSESYGKSASAHSPHFSARISTALAGKASVVVSKKVAATSVARNLLRRRVYGALESIGSAKVSVIIFAKKGAPALKGKALDEEIKTLLRHVL